MPLFFVVFFSSELIAIQKVLCFIEISREVSFVIFNDSLTGCVISSDTLFLACIAIYC